MPEKGPKSPIREYYWAVHDLSYVGLHQYMSQPWVLNVAPQQSTAGHAAQSIETPNPQPTLHHMRSSSARAKAMSCVMSRSRRKIVCEVQGTSHAQHHRRYFGIETDNV